MPHVHSIKSNARREARRRNLDPETAVRAHNGGWAVFDASTPKAAGQTAAGKPKGKGLKARTLARMAANRAASQTAAAHATPPRTFPSFGRAKAAAAATIKRAGLNSDALVVVELTDTATGMPRFGFVPAAEAANFVVVTEAPTKPAESTAKRSRPTAREAKRKRSDKPRDAGGSKGDDVLTMLLQPSGAAMPDICKATGWLPHTARARISGLAQKHNLTIERKRLMNVTWYYATQNAKTKEAA